MKSREIQWDTVFGRILIISIPLMIICIAANITMRMPDTYQYSLSDSQILNSAPVVVDEGKLVNLFGDYMQHKTNDFALKESVDYKPEDVFNDKDRAAMHHLRTALDIVLAVGIIALIMTAVCYFFLIRWRRKVIHMEYLKKSFLMFLIMSVLWALAKAVPFFRSLTWGHLFGSGFKTGDILIMVLQDKFSLQVTVFDLVISFVIMGMLAYGTWEVAGRKKMFKRR